MSDITIELDSPCGPRVIYPLFSAAAFVEAEVPEGWSVDWETPPVRLSTGELASPLRREPGAQGGNAEPADVQSLIVSLLYEAGIDGVEEHELHVALRIDATTAGTAAPSLDDTHQAIRALAATGTIEPAGRTGFRISTREWAWTLLGQIEYLVSDAGERTILAQRFRRTLAGRGR